MDMFGAAELSASAGPAVAASAAEAARSFADKKSSSRRYRINRLMPLIASSSTQPLNAK